MCPICQNTKTYAAVYQVTYKAVLVVQSSVGALTVLVEEGERGGLLSVDSWTLRQVRRRSSRADHTLEHPLPILTRSAPAKQRARVNAPRVFVPLNTTTYQR